MKNLSRLLLSMFTQMLTCISDANLSLYCDQAIRYYPFLRRVTLAIKNGATSALIPGKDKITTSFFLLKFSFAIAIFNKLRLTSQIYCCFLYKQTNNKYKFKNTWIIY